MRCVGSARASTPASQSRVSIDAAELRILQRAGDRERRAHLDGPGAQLELQPPGQVFLRIHFALSRCVQQAGHHPDLANQNAVGVRGHAAAHLGKGRRSSTGSGAFMEYTPLPWSVPPATSGAAILAASIWRAAISPSRLQPPDHLRRALPSRRPPKARASASLKASSLLVTVPFAVNSSRARSAPIGSGNFSEEISTAAFPPRGCSFTESLRSASTNVT